MTMHPEPLSKEAMEQLNAANENHVLCVDGIGNCLAGPDSEDMPNWYYDLLYLADLAEEDPRYAWENLNCHLCKKEIDYMDAEEMIFIHEDKLYTLLSTKILASLDNKFTNEYGPEGFLRCVYCFNTYHHRPCVFTMSKKTYLHHRRNKSWACPSCVPDYELQQKLKGCKMRKKKTKKVTVTTTSDDGFLGELIQFLNFVMQNTIDASVLNCLDSIIHHAINYSQMFDIG